MTGVQKGRLEIQIGDSECKISHAWGVQKKFPPLSRKYEKFYNWINSPVPLTFNPMFKLSSAVFTVQSKEIPSLFMYITVLLFARLPEHQICRVLLPARE